MNPNRFAKLTNKVVASLPMGKTLERGSIRIHRWHTTVRVTDLTNAGKRGKRCDQAVVYNIDYAERDASSEIEEMMDGIERARNYAQALKVMEKSVDEINVVSKMGVKFDEQIERGVDVAPGGFSKIKINGKNVYIEADFSRFVVRDKVDMNNEPTCIPGARGKKTSIKMFYRWATDNENFIKRATFSEVLDSMTKAGIPYHYYCAMD